MVEGPGTDELIPAWLQRLGIPGITDLHVHFMPETVQRKVWAYFDGLGETESLPWPVTYRHDDEHRAEILQQLGVVAYTTLNYAHRPGMARWLNEYSAAFAESHPQAIRSGTFFPEPGAADVVRDALADGVRIFKVHIQVGGFSPLDPQLDESWGILASARTPVVIHCGNGPQEGEHTGIGPVRELMRRHPDLVLVIAHAGLPEYREFAELAGQHSGVHLDTTMVGTDFTESFMPMPSDYLDLLTQLPGKVVLGSDFPTIPYPYSHQLDALAGWDLGEDWLRDALWNTPRRLVGLPLEG